MVWKQMPPLTVSKTRCDLNNSDGHLCFVLEKFIISNDIRDSFKEIKNCIL